MTDTFIGLKTHENHKTPGHDFVMIRWLLVLMAGGWALGAEGPETGDEAVIALGRELMAKRHVVEPQLAESERAYECRRPFSRRKTRLSIAAYEACRSGASAARNRDAVVDCSIIQPAGECVPNWRRYPGYEWYVCLDLDSPIRSKTIPALEWNLCRSSPRSSGTGGDAPFESALCRAVSECHSVLPEP